MTEMLYIRLGSQAQDKVHWLVWSSSQKEIIASGELASAADLSSLTEKAKQRMVMAVVPSQDVLLKALKVPGKSDRAIHMAAPYMLEEELAQDVDQLFFAYGAPKHITKDDNCFVAVVKHSQMQQWQQWLVDANIGCDTMVPELLLLPYQENAWSALAIDDTVIIRQGDWQGMSLDSSLLAVAAQQWQQLQEPQPVIHTYTSLPNVEAFASAGITIEPQPEDLPLAVFAQRGKPAFNLLQGQYKAKNQRAPWLKNWSLAAGLCALALTLTFGQKVATYYQVKAESQALEQQIVASYKKAFPNTKRVRINTIKSQLKRKLAEQGQQGSEQTFLPMLTDMQTAFTQVPSLKPTSLKFDGKRGEIRLQASAKNYQAFDKFKSALEKKQLEVTQGAQNNQGDLVTGSISIKRRS